MTWCDEQGRIWKYAERVIADGRGWYRVARVLVTQAPRSVTDGRGEHGEEHGRGAPATD